MPQNTTSSRVVDFPFRPTLDRLRIPQIVFGLALVLHAIAVPEINALEIWLPFEDAYEYSDFVCVADAIEYLPAPEPTPQHKRTTASYRLRVIHVWKGDPPDTLDLRAGHGREHSPAGTDSRWTIACGGPRSFEPGHRYVVFASSNPHHDLPAAHSHTRELHLAQADLLALERTKGPGRRIVNETSEIPTVSYRSMLHDFVHGDSAIQIAMIHTFRETGDSAGIILPTVGRYLRSARSALCRRTACNLLGSWSQENMGARRALLAAIDHSRPEIRLAAVEANCYCPYDELEERILERFNDPIPEVRAAALRRVARRLRSEHPPTSIYLDSLCDSAAIVRQEAVLALKYAIEDPDVRTAIEEMAEDPDPRVASAAKMALRKAQ